MKAPVQESSLIKLQTPEMQLYEKETPTQVIFCEICEIFKSTSLYRTSLVAASEDFRFPASNFIEKETPEKIFFSEFCKIFKNIFSFDRTPPDDCFVCLSVNLEFFRTLFLQSTSGKLLFHVSQDTVTRSFQVFYTRTRSSHSKAFIYLKSLKIVCEEVNL